MAAQQQQGDFGVVGMGVMGSNLALNLADRGAAVVGWDRDPAHLARVVGGAAHPRLVGEPDLAAFVRGLARPRRVLVMVTAGAAVDAVLERVLPLLEPGDVLMDGGNSWYLDTRARGERCAARGVHFLGVGVSGGEEGARHGPSLMPGGPAPAWEAVRAPLEAIAARAPGSGACVTHVGPEGSGHFVKMVHNGIEYADMQLLAEAYDLLGRGLGLSAGQIADVMAGWSEGVGESFLLETTVRVLRKRDAETGRPLVDLVLDRAGQKGTGKWTLQVALDLAVPVPSIAAALDARVLSSLKEERVAASSRLPAPVPSPVASALSEAERGALAAWVHDALYASRIATYAQGMRLIQAASAEHGWGVSLAEMARIWRAGCIIRARLLTPLREAFLAEPQLPNLMASAAFAPELAARAPAWRRAVGVAVRLGIPAPALSASLAYFDSYRTADLPQNLTQAQRDAFGAHTYVRRDHPERGPVHTDWS
jgi:6-phosphogluconate dehydrogenase